MLQRCRGEKEWGVSTARFRGAGGNWIPAGRDFSSGDVAESGLITRIRPSAGVRREPRLGGGQVPGGSSSPRVSADI